MANSLSTFNPEVWAKTAQLLHKPMAIYRQVANFRGESQLSKGDKFHRIRPNRTLIQNVTRYSDLSVQDISGSDESLDIDREKGFLFQVADMDEVQSNIGLVAEYSKNAIRDLTNRVDADMLYEAVNASSVVDNADFGGTSGHSISLSGSNVFDVMTEVVESLAEQNAGWNGLYGVIDPATFGVINSQVGARETLFGDSVTRNGFEGNMIRYNGFDLYVTNNYTRRLRLDLATQPTDGDTVVLTFSGNGISSTAVTFTFKTSLGSTAGNVLIGASADTARANLAGLINAPGTTSSTQVALSATNQMHMSNVVAVDDASGNTLTIYVKGFACAGTETLTDTTDGFNSSFAGKVLQFGRKGAVDMIIQDAPKFKVREEPKQLTSNVIGNVLYGVKTYTDGAEELVKVLVA